MQVAKWGNSLAVRLPKALVERLGLREGDHIDIVDATAGHLAIAKADVRSEALARMAEQAWELPPDYRFDRDEANAR